jgi:hypothetical protein
VTGPHSSYRPVDGEDISAIASHCPQCGAEYRLGFDTCADCGIPLEPGPAEATADDDGIRRSPNLDWTKGPGVDIAVVDTRPWDDAWILRDTLEEEGIPALVHPDFINPRIPHDRAMYDVVVRKDDLEAAREVAMRLREESDGDDEASVASGEQDPWGWS